MQYGLVTFIQKEAGVAVGYAMNQMGVHLTHDPRNKKIMAILEEITDK